MKIEQETLQGSTIIAPHGELDAANVPALRRVFEQVLRDIRDEPDFDPGVKVTFEGVRSARRLLASRSYK